MRERYRAPFVLSGNTFSSRNDFTAQIKRIKNWKNFQKKEVIKVKVYDSFNKPLFLQNSISRINIWNL